jgi:hypothetical protein
VRDVDDLPRRVVESGLRGIGEPATGVGDAVGVREDEPPAGAEVGFPGLLRSGEHVGGPGDRRDRRGGHGGADPTQHEPSTETARFWFRHRQSLQRAWCGRKALWHRGFRSTNGFDHFELGRNFLSPYLSDDQATA